MPRRFDRWALILLCFTLGCAGFPLLRKDHLASGIKNYKETEYSKAIEELNRVLKKDPNAVSAHRYLYLSYEALKNEPMAIFHLMKLIQLQTTEVNVYRRCYDYYRSHQDHSECFEILLAACRTIPNKLDPFIVVTRENLASFFCGASVRYRGGDCISFVQKSGLIPVFPDGNFYPQDRITFGNFALLIDRSLPDRPDLIRTPYPALEKVNPQSLYYRPMLKLIGYKVIEPDEVRIPEEYLPLTLAVNFIKRLKKVLNF